MDIKDIAESPERQMIFNAVLEEACRQWCDFLPEAPERMDGEGFAGFFYEIFEQKEAEYVRDAETRRQETAVDFKKQEDKPSVRKQLEEIRSRKHPGRPAEKETQEKQHGMEL